MGYEEGVERPFSIKMKLEETETSLATLMIDRKGEPLPLEEFFPVFRDSILALTCLHAHSIAHRDISPHLIFRKSANSWALADFGNGLHLGYLKQYIAGDFY